MCFHISPLQLRDPEGQWRRLHNLWNILHLCKAPVPCKDVTWDIFWKYSFKAMPQLYRHLIQGLRSQPSLKGVSCFTFCSFFIKENFLRSCIGENCPYKNAARRAQDESEPYHDDCEFRINQQQKGSNRCYLDTKGDVSRTTALVLRLDIQLLRMDTVSCRIQSIRS